MLPVFRYTTLAEVKGRIDPNLLTGTGALADADILRQIEQASAAVNAWTRQVFQPYPDTVASSAKGDRLAYHPQFLPIVDLAEIALDQRRSTGQFKEMDRIIPGMRNFPERQRSFRFGPDGNGFYSFIEAQGGGKVAWMRGERLLSLVTLLGGFIAGFQNLEMTGWFGWLERYKLVRTTLATQINAFTANATVLHVAGVIDAETGQVLEPGDTIALTVIDGDKVPKQIELAVVQSIAAHNVSGFNLTVDPLHPWPVAIPVGAKIVAWGRVPMAMNEVAAYCAAQSSARLYAERASDPAAIAAFEGNLQSEKTDNYSYTLRAGGGSINAGGDSVTGRYTGSVKMDLLLRQFVKPSPAIRVL